MMLNSCCGTCMHPIVTLNKFRWKLTYLKIPSKPRQFDQPKFWTKRRILLARFSLGLGGPWFTNNFAIQLPLQLCTYTFMGGGLTLKKHSVKAVVPRVGEMTVLSGSRVPHFWAASCARSFRSLAARPLQISIHEKNATICFEMKLTALRSKKVENAIMFFIWAEELDPQKPTSKNQWQKLWHTYTHTHNWSHENKILTLNSNQRNEAFDHLSHWKKSCSVPIPKWKKISGVNLFFVHYYLISPLSRINMYDMPFSKNKYNP